MRVALVVTILAGLGCGDKKPAEKPAPGASGSATVGPAIDARAGLGGIDVPETPAHGVVPIDDDAIVVSVTRASIKVDGNPIIDLVDGAVGPADLEGGALGMNIPALGLFLGKAAKLVDHRARVDDPAATTDPLVVIVADRRVPSKLVAQIVHSSSQIGVKRVGIAALAGGRPMMVPVTLPERKPPKPNSPGGTLAGAKPGEPGPAPEVRPIVSFQPGQVMLWSVSGLLGTIQEPRLRLTDPATAGPALTEELAAFVASRWPAGTARSEEDREALVLVESRTPIEAVVPVMAAMRADDKGTELFPTLVLSSGFE